MSVKFYRGSPGKFDSRTLNRITLNRWTGRTKQLCMDRVLRAKEKKNNINQQ